MPNGPAVTDRKQTEGGTEMEQQTQMTAARAMEILVDEFDAERGEVERLVMERTAGNHWRWQEEYRGSVALVQPDLFGGVRPIVVVYDNGDWEDFALSEALYQMEEPQNQPRYREFVAKIERAAEALREAGDLADEIGFDSETVHALWELATDVEKQYGPLA